MFQLFLVLTRTRTHSTTVCLSHSSQPQQLNMHMSWEMLMHELAMAATIHGQISLSSTASENCCKWKMSVDWKWGKRVYCTVYSNLSTTSTPWILLCPTTAPLTKKVSPGSEKLLPPLVGSVPKHGSMYTLHCAPQATSTRLHNTWVLFYIAPKLGHHTVCATRTTAFAGDASAVFAGSSGGTRSETKSFCSASAIGPCVVISKKAFALTWSRPPFSWVSFTKTIFSVVKIDIS